MQSPHGFFRPAARRRRAFLFCVALSKSFAADEGLSLQAAGLNGIVSLVASPKSNVKSLCARKARGNARHVKNAAARLSAKTEGRARRA